MPIQKTKPTSTPSVTSPIQSGNSQAKAQAERLQQVLAPALENRKLSEIKDKKERLLELANIIERAELVKRDIGFNMSTFERARSYEDMTGHKCGTTACIAGWTTQFSTTVMTQRVVTPISPFKHKTSLALLTWKLMSYSLLTG